MFPIAHTAAAALFNRLALKDDSLIPAALGSLLPDAVDKPLAWVLRVTPSSHHIAHTPVAAVALSAVAARLFGARTALGFGSAYLAHLVCDDLFHGRVPWLLPFSSYRRRPPRKDRRLLMLGLLLEVPALLLLVFLSRWRITPNTPVPCFPIRPGRGEARLVSAQLTDSLISTAPRNDPQ